MEVIDFIDCSLTTLYTNQNTGKPIHKKFYVRSTWEMMDVDNPGNSKKYIEEKPIVKIPKEPKKSKKQLEYERIIKHLDIYGNTITMKDPRKQYGKRFEKDGYFIEVEHRPRMVMKKAATKEWDREVWDEIWIITLKRKEKRE